MTLSVRVHIYNPRKTRCVVIFCCRCANPTPPPFGGAFFGRPRSKSASAENLLTLAMAEGIFLPAYLMHTVGDRLPLYVVGKLNKACSYVLELLLLTDHHL